MNMEKITSAMARLNEQIRSEEAVDTIPFQDFIGLLAEHPESVLRNVFQVFHDMIKHHVTGEAHNDSRDSDLGEFMDLDFTSLFVDETFHPFFADRLLAKRLFKLAENMRHGAQQNKIYIFDGPAGCGKSTFLNNLLLKFEAYANTEQGLRYEVVWRLDRKVLGWYAEDSKAPFSGRLQDMQPPPENLQRDCSRNGRDMPPLLDDSIDREAEPYIEITCPSHDHPILIITKSFRSTFLDELFKNDQFKWRLFTEKEYGWVFKDTSCTICSSIYEALIRRLKTSNEVFDMVHARPYRFNRRLGEGISVFNPGDKPLRNHSMTNPMLQRRINTLLKDSNQVKYLFSQYAKTNNGIYALMDIKSHNVERLMELHNIISEGLHKVEEIEEGVNSMFIALMNPEDKKNVAGLPSFSDRIEFIKIPYVLDRRTEVEIYRSIFGKLIDTNFLPRVLNNFARVVMSTRLDSPPPALKQWIVDPAVYRRYCDENMLLLKMEIYAGHIPTWLNEKDRNAFTQKVRGKILSEAEFEGQKGLSGRDSIRIFGDFLSRYARPDKLINMSELCLYFSKERSELGKQIPGEFLESLHDMYDYMVLEEVKDAMYDYNESEISRTIKNYMYAVNLDMGASETCRYTGDRIEVTEEFFSPIEDYLMGEQARHSRRLQFREDVQKTYVSKTLTQEILVGATPVEQTKLYADLLERYIHRLKEKVLDPFLKNENFRKAIKDYNHAAFKTYDNRIRRDVTFLMKNLYDHHGYSAQGAKEVCIYVIDNDLPQRFAG